MCTHLLVLSLFLLLQGEVEAKVKARRDEAQAQARKIEAAAKARHAAAAKVSAASTASGTSANANASLKGRAGESQGSVGVGGGVGKGNGSSGGQAGSEGGDDGNNNYNGTLVAVADPQREMSQAERAQVHCFYWVAFEAHFIHYCYFSSAFAESFICFRASCTL